MKIIQTNNAPSVVGPYSQAIATDQFIFCSGQIGIEPTTGELAIGIEEQTKQVIKNLQAVLAAAGSDLNHIVKTTIFLASMNDYLKVNEIYGSFFADHKPARSTFAVNAL